MGADGLALHLDSELLDQAGMSTGVPLHAEIRPDGWLVLRRADAVASDSERTRFEQAVAAVLQNRRELLERLAQ